MNALIVWVFRLINPGKETHQKLEMLRKNLQNNLILKAQISG